MISITNEILYIGKAKNFLEDLKGKYYDEIKLRPGVTQEQQKAMDFFNRYNENKQRAAKQHEEFVDRTNDYFTKDFKGFEFNLGEQKFNYSINNAQDVAKNQIELQNFVKTFLNEDGSINDHKFLTKRPHILVLDVNKLIGFSDCDRHHSQYSCRVGWRASGDSIELLIYKRDDNNIEFKLLKKVYSDQIVNVTLDFKDTIYTSCIDGICDTLVRPCPDWSGRKYSLFPFFGGQETAPHKMKIRIK